MKRVLIYGDSNTWGYDSAALHFEINTVDGLHYSRADHARLAPVVAGKIREMLD